MKHVPETPFAAGRGKNKRLYIFDAKSAVVCGGFSSLEMPDKVAARIVASVNNTWEAGINPGAVPDLLECLKIMCEYWEWSIQDPNFHAYKNAKEALEKAKLSI